MFLDEKLLQMEAEKNKREKQEKRFQEIKEDISQQERAQKTVEDRIRELDCKLVEIKGKNFVCERKKVAGDHISIFIFPDDVDRIIEENNIAMVTYRTLEIGTSTTFLNQPSVIKNQKEFQDKLIKQYLQEKRTYYPLEAGVLKSGKYKICFAEGVFTSAVGGVFVNNFFCGGNKRTIIGNYSCRLVERYTFGNLFRAMLTQMFEEDK